MKKKRNSVIPEAAVVKQTTTVLTVVLILYPYKVYEWNTINKTFSFLCPSQVYAPIQFLP